MIATVQAVLLDAAGTLVGLEPPAPRLTRLLAERFGIEVGEPDAAAAFRVEVAYYRVHMQQGRDAASLQELRRECAEVLFTALPDPGPLARIGSGARTALLLDCLRFRAFPEVPEVLAVLRSAGMRLVVASNWDCSLPDVLDHVGLADAVDGFVSSALLGAVKPDPRLLLSAAETAGVEPGSAVHVGDSVAEDVAAARAAGIPVVLVDRDDRGHAPDGVPSIPSLRELPGLLGL